MKSGFYKKGIVLFVIALGLILMGATYSLWMDTSIIESKITTGSMNMILPSTENEGYRVELIRLSDENEERRTSDSIRCIDSEFKISEDGKSADIRFKERIPVELLAEDYLLSISFPIQAQEDNSIKFIKNREMEAELPDTRLSMIADKVYLAFNSELFSLRDGEMYKTDLNFDVFSELDGESKEQMTGRLYLKPDEESKEFIRSFKERELVLNKEELELIDTTDSELYRDASGLIIEYHLENIPLMIEQGE